MMALRQLHGQFGSYLYDSGLVAANADVTIEPNFPQIAENRASPYGSDTSNDRLLESAVGANLNGGLHFGTYQYVDLRDLFEDRQCMDDIVINVQRQLDAPVPTFWANMGIGPIIETFCIINDELDLTQGGSAWNALTGGAWHMIGFDDINVVLGNYKSLLYRETRRYVINPAQTFRSPTDMSSYTGLTGTAAGVNGNQWVAAYTLESRTVGGYPSRLIGPGMTVIRAWSMYPANRSDRRLNGGGLNDVIATNYEFAEGKMQMIIPMLQWNIIGNRRNMTDEEIALDYSSKLIMQESS